MLVTGDAAFGVVPGGQSGNPYSPHYRDQLDAWASGEYRRMSLRPQGERELVFVRGDSGDGGGDSS